MFSHHSRHLAQVGLSLLAASAGGICHAEYALFDEITDTIGFAGDTILSTTATFEAVVSLSATSRGHIFFEQVNALEHKDLTISGNGFGGAGWTYIVNETEFEGSQSMSLNVFHHIAFVRDGSEERLYFDGDLLATRSAIGTISNSPQASHPGAIGASALDITEFPLPSFLGLLDSVRVSDIARYSGPSITAPTGDMIADAGTLLLFNFNADEVYGSYITDVSGNGHDGRLGYAGIGFDSYTSPSIVPEPGSASLLLMGGALLCRRKRKG